MFSVFGYLLSPSVLTVVDLLVSWFQCSCHSSNRQISLQCGDIGQNIFFPSLLFSKEQNLSEARPAAGFPPRVSLAPGWVSYWILNQTPGKRAGQLGFADSLSSMLSKPTDQTPSGFSKRSEGRFTWKGLADNLSAPSSAKCPD